MKKLLIILLSSVLLTVCFKTFANNESSRIGKDPYIVLEHLPDSIKTIIENKKFMMYDYGHHGKNWCLIYEDKNSYVITIGTTRQKKPNLNAFLDTLQLLDSYRNLISWGMDSLPEITKKMDPLYQKEWSPFYSTLNVYNAQSVCVFDSNNAIGFSGLDERDVNKKFADLCYLMLWLSAPDIRKNLPGFEQFEKK